MGFIYEFPPDDPRFVPVARLRFVCPHHLDELLVEWCISFPDPEVYYMDEHVWNNAAPGYHQQFTGPPVPTEDWPILAAVGVSLPDALTVEGDVHHWRACLRCPRPSCGYDAQMRGPEFFNRIKLALRKMAAAGMAVMTVTSPEGPNGWHAVRT